LVIDAGLSAAASETPNAKEIRTARDFRNIDTPSLERRTLISAPANARINVNRTKFVAPDQGCGTLITDASYSKYRA
jgi:hypothetical protein